MGDRTKIDKIEIPVGAEFMYKDMRIIAQVGSGCHNCVFFGTCPSTPLACMASDRKDRMNVTFVEIPKERPRIEFEIDKLILPLDMVLRIDGEEAQVREDSYDDPCIGCVLEHACGSHPACHWAMRPDERGVKFVKLEKECP